MTPDTSSARKARGAFFTPSEVSAFLTEWAVRTPADLTLEPSCGEASFLLAAAKRLRALGAHGDLSPQLSGVEVHEPSARYAADLLSTNGFNAHVQVSDFFEVRPSPVYDAVFGNPPYIRYQAFAGAARARALQAALAHGVRLTGLASSWAAFTVHASQFLKPDGRLALVLPAELLSVNYASQVRRFLLNRFGKVRLVMFEELVFPGVLEEVVLLLAEGQGPSPSFEVIQTQNFGDLSTLRADGWIDFRPGSGDKWTPALLRFEALDAYKVFAEGTGFCPLLDWGETYLGAVTGNNSYFTLSATKARELALTGRELLAISPPGSRHLRGLTFSDRSWKSLAADGEACLLFAPDADSPSKAASRYIAAGEASGVHEAYKCKVREPWWRVPLVKVPDLLLTYMDQERPRFVRNEAKANVLNSLYGISLRKAYRSLGADLLPMATLNSVTLLSGEMIGRAYGGGLLKLEPKEADLLKVPSPQLLASVAKELRDLRPSLGADLRAGRLLEAVKKVDRVLLSRALGAPSKSIRALREAREHLFSRRRSRGRGARG
jgi:adenine-specific DNA-methyltransferase